MMKINCKFLDNMLLKSVHNVSFSNWKLFDMSLHYHRWHAKAVFLPHSVEEIGVVWFVARQLQGRRNIYVGTLRLVSTNIWQIS
mgnify:CR=1 FL=1